MMKIGYARVSSYGQKLDVQLEHLKSADCEKIFQEKVSGKDAATRKQLQAALGYGVRPAKLRELQVFLKTHPVYVN